MEEWKFLLQKDGDRSWLPLDSPDAEILEGRYRLVARSSQANTDIGIRICHLATEEDPPKRRIHKRSSRTNENGLMVVIPFTHLQPGIWELSCFSTDPMSDLLGDTLHHTVCLRVAAPVAESDLEDWSEPAYAVESIHPLNSPEDSAEPPAQGDAENLAAVLVPASGFLPRSYPCPAPSEVEEPVPALNVLTLRLQLQNSALMASRGQGLTVSGQVVVDDLAQLETEIPAAWLHSDSQTAAALSYSLEGQAGGATSAWAGVVAQELQLCLRDPQSSTIILREQHPLPDGVPPLTFSFSVSLPYTLATHLLLGEVVLYGMHPDQPEAAIALQVAPFTVTVDPENLVEELKKVHAVLSSALVEEQSRGEELADLAVQFSAKLRREKLGATLDLSFLDLTSPTPGLEGLPMPEPAPQPTELVMAQATNPAVDATGATQPRPKQILPPQLHPPIERPTGRKHLELPVFINRSAPSSPPVPPQEAALIDDLFAAALENPIEEPLSFRLEDPGTDDRVAEEIASVEAVPGDVPDSIVVQDPAIAAPDSTHLSDTPTVAPTPPVPALSVVEEEVSLPVRLEFKSLNLQDRFLDRLNRLAGDQSLTASLKRSLHPPGVESVVTAAVDVATVVPESSGFSEVGAMAKEVVIEDDPSWRDQVLRSPRLRSRSDSAPGNLLALPEDTPIPTPEVEVLTHEIIAGYPLHLRVKLPDHLPPTCVKLWISDRQTRSLLDGPRWLMDLSPNGLDEVTTDVEVTAPEGSLEIRIEAISVELQSQRESQKISLERSVEPSELPNLWDDEIQF